MIGRTGRQVSLSRILKRNSKRGSKSEMLERPQQRLPQNLEIVPPVRTAQRNLRTRARYVLDRGGAEVSGRAGRKISLGKTDRVQPHRGRNDRRSIRRSRGERLRTERARQGVHGAPLAIRVTIVTHRAGSIDAAVRWRCGNDLVRCTLFRIYPGRSGRRR